MYKAAKPEIVNHTQMYVCISANACMYKFQNYLKIIITHAFSRVKEIYTFDKLINDNKMKSTHIFTELNISPIYPN